MKMGERAAINRRGFVGLLGLAGAGTVGSALAPEHIGRAAGIEAVQTVAEADSHAGHEQMSAQTTSTNATQDMTVDEMDAMHDASVKAFPAATQGIGGQPLEFVMDGGVKVFELTC